MSALAEILDDFDAEHTAGLVAQAREVIAQSFSPPPRFSVSEWADDRRMLSSEASSEPGKWRTSRVEPSRGVMDAFSDPEVEQITCMVAAQSFKTEALLNILGFHVDLDPCPVLVLQPTLQMAEAFSKDRLAPMVRDTPVVGAKIGNHARDSEDTILHKKFAGGHITMAGANSPASLASRPIRILLADEVDRYDASAGKEGDPVSLAIERTTNFWNRKIALFSTPTIKGASRIEAAYEESDQRRYFVRCPACSHEQVFRWRPEIVGKAEVGGVRWPEGRPLEARFHCAFVDPDSGEVCDHGFSEGERLESIATGRWVATRPEVKGHAGFHLSRMASPWRSLGVMARDFVLAKPHPERLKTWVNTRLAETWEERGERADPKSLLERREPYAAEPVPFGVGTVVAGVDIQDDRFEIEWVGYGAEDESWSLDYARQYGDPASPSFWDRLDDALLRGFQHPSGITLRVEAACVDAGGHFTQQVYDFCRSRKRRNVFPILGRAGKDKPIWPQKLTKNAAKKIDVAIVGVDQGKDVHYKRLSVKQPGPSYCHFPLRESGYDQAHFDGLTAEKAVLKTDKQGFTSKVWVKVHVRNEPLDVRVYATAARLALGIDMARRLHALRQAFEASRQHSLNPPEQPQSKNEEDSPRRTATVAPRRRMLSKGVNH